VLLGAITWILVLGFPGADQMLGDWPLARQARRLGGRGRVAIVCRGFCIDGRNWQCRKTLAIRAEERSALMSDDVGERYAGVNARQAKHDALVARSRATAALVMSLVAMLLSVIAVFWR
jgi:hypothetical protein